MVAELKVVIVWEDSRNEEKVAGGDVLCHPRKKCSKWAEVWTTRVNADGVVRVRLAHLPGCELSPRWQRRVLSQLTESS